MNTTAIQQMNEGAFDEQMRSSYRKVYNLAFRLAGNRSDAEDLCQEAFYRAYRSFDQYQGDKPFENWIFRIVTRLFLDMVRNRKRRIQAVSYDAPVRADSVENELLIQTADDAPTPEEILMNNNFSEQLMAGLDSLRPDQKTLIMLADVEMLPYNDIADIMQIPVGTVRSRLHRTHRKLRAHMEAAQKRNQKKQYGNGMNPCPRMDCA